MNLNGKRVVHKSFGEGVIVDLTGAFITISFGFSTKKFIYPDAFREFLTLSDNDFESMVKKDLNAAETKKVCISEIQNRINASVAKNAKSKKTKLAKVIPIPEEAEPSDVQLNNDPM